MHEDGGAALRLGSDDGGGPRGAGQVEPEVLRGAVGDALDVFEAELDLVVADGSKGLRALPGYRDLRGEGPARVRAAMRRSMVMIARRLREGADLRPEDEAFYRALGARRAASGVPLQAVRDAVDQAHERAVVHLSRVVARRAGVLSSEVSGWLSRRLTRLVPAALNSIELGYAEALADKASPAEQALLGAADAVLDQKMDRLEVQARLERAGLRGPSRWRPILLAGRCGRDARLLSAAREVGRAVGVSLVTTPTSHPTPHVVVLAGSSAEDSAVARLEDIADEYDVTIVVGMAVVFERLAATCVPVRGQLGLAGVVAGERGVIDDLELMRYAVLDNPTPEATDWFIDRVLAPVRGADASRWEPATSLGELHDADGDLDLAAGRLGLARRTVRGHRAKLLELLGLERDQLRGLGDVVVALRLARQARWRARHDDAASPPSHGRSSWVANLPPVAGSGDEVATVTIDPPSGDP